MSSRLLREVESQSGAWSEQVEGRERRDDALVLFIADELLLLAEGAPMIVGFASFETKPLKCGETWDACTKSATNKPNNNFGCAITANMAAMVSNPADLAGPRPDDPSDAQRRDTVLGKYRTGGVTSGAKDSAAGGAVSTAVQ